MKYINLFDTQAAYDAAEKYYPNVSYIEATDEVVYQENDPLYSSYLTFEALQNGTFTLTVPAVVDSTKMTSVSYSTDGGTTWTDTTIDNTAQTITTPTINAGSKVLWKGIGNEMYTSSFSSTGNFNVSGNIMSMLYGDNFIGQTSFASGSESNFPNLFSGYAKLISAANLVLPATTLTNNCYRYMFINCTALTTAPALPATTLTQGCYYGMFQGCTSLTTAPALPATTLASNCYNSMFSGCTSLTTAPSLNATTLTQGCYNEMFKRCSNLTTAPSLPATTLASNCYNSMFNGCTSLTTAPDLPATTLNVKCYSNMFNGCSNLNSIKIDATDISANQCLFNWVSGVAASGTFTKDASMTTLPTGASGIPENWTVVEIN